MIRVSAMYPPSEKFDHDYYVNNHMKMVQDRIGDALLKFEVDRGVAGGAPGSPAPYAAIGHLYFNSVQEFAQAFGQHAGEIMGDVPNFTDAQGQIQISEIVSG
jgi:uncharacterized protein (TIGR02118 family)